jgi:putative endonuclease
MAFLGVHSGEQVAPDLHGGHERYRAPSARTQNREIEGFTQRYKINRLVYRERFHYIGNAIEREKEIKGWDRARKVALIESENPTWEDLSLEWGKPVEMLTPATASGKQIPRGLKPTRDDNSLGASTCGELAQEQQIPRSARDDNSGDTGCIGDERILTTKT